MSTFGFRGNHSSGSVALADGQQTTGATTASMPPTPHAQRTDRRPPFVPSSYRVDALKSWTGVVRELDREFFVAELEDPSDNSTFMAEFERSQLGFDEDLTLGDVVYVTVRSVNSQFGPSKTTSIRMRRLGRWTQAELDSIQLAAHRKARELERLLGD
ncbi:hypothetical protein [Curtobacterium sp. Leaf261]|uniref:hypothetical protein n=1 Tax=Curtobacterium sp. Leaf261 TaxID=1736311 RepID=UPI0012E1BDA7|nr:hypothetical protein [Curtobacterium sp. Leaf261]